METKAERRANEKAPWRKVLFEKQDYADNYTDISFLALLSLCPPARPYDYWQIVYESLAVIGHISAIAIFGAVFTFANQGLLGEAGLLGVVLCAGLSFALWFCAGQSYWETPSMQAVKGVCLALCAMLGLTPVLGTLTSSVSTDSLYALTSLALVLSCFTTDFYPEPGSRLAGFNEILFAALCLSSRLPSPLSVFSFLMLTLELFLLLPLVARVHRQISPLLYIVTTVCISLLATTLLWQLSHTCAEIYLGAVGSLVTIGPLWLIRAARHRRSITGPWDEVTLSAKARRTGSSQSEQLLQ